MRLRRESMLRHPSRTQTNDSSRTSIINLRMPTIFTHPAVPLALAVGLGRNAIPSRLLTAGVAASILPDVDVLAFSLGVPYGSAFGHRGFTHSLAFAAAVGFVGALFHRALGSTRIRAAAFLFLATASHGALDALTTGGSGIAFLWPWSEARYFAPVQVIEVSPIGLRRFLSQRGVDVILSELAWVWSTCALAALLLRLAQRVALAFKQSPA